MSEPQPFFHIDEGRIVGNFTVTPEHVRREGDQIVLAGTLTMPSTKPLTHGPVSMPVEIVLRRRDNGTWASESMTVNPDATTPTQLVAANRD